MAAAPVFAVTPNTGPKVTTSATANTDRDGVGAAKVLIFQAGASGSVFTGTRIMSRGTNALCVLRFFLNNNADPEVATNNSLIDEVIQTATTASETAAQIPGYALANLNMRPNHRIYVTRSAFTSGNAGFDLLGEGADL